MASTLMTSFTMAELVPSLPVTSNHHFCFTARTSGLSLAKVKTTNGNTYGHTHHFCKSFWRQNLIVQFTPFDYGEKLICHTRTHLTRPITWSPTTCGIICLHFRFHFVKDLRQWGVSLMYIHTCSVLMSSVPFTIHLKNHKWEPSKDTFLVQFFSQLYT
jgi:hypothetical protein